MHILIISWRDIANPSSGGAEIYTHQIFKQLIRFGHQITHISNRYSDNQDSSHIDGVHYIRIGLKSFPYLFMFSSYYYLVTHYNQLRPDLIINCIHGLPNLTSPYLPSIRGQLAGKQSVPPTIYLAFELAGPIWFKQTNFPFNIVGFYSEKLYTKLLHDLPFVTISPSQSQLLLKAGVSNLTVIPPGIHLRTSNNFTAPTKSLNPLFISLGRLAPMKQLDHTIKAFYMFHKRYPKSRLIILGRGTPRHLKYLYSLVTSYNLEKCIRIPGFVSENQKYQLLAKSWALISTSINEGWGLNVIEAASVGTPTLAYRSPGLIDTVRHRYSGLLTNKNNPAEINKLMIEITNNSQLRFTLGKSARLNVKQYTWDQSVSRWHKLITRTTKP